MIIYVHAHKTQGLLYCLELEISDPVRKMKSKN